jgi:uronate dehydrogenase
MPEKVAPVPLTGAPAAPVLLTGASGALGRVLARGLAAEGVALRLTDIAPFPDPVPAGATFTEADLVDGPAIECLAAGCRAILHFGGVSVERPFAEVLGPNIQGLFHIYEAAKREGARVVFPSSNHTVGFHERTTPLDAECQFRPDGFYGLSKCYGELMGRLYFDKHGVESVNIRIGTCLAEPQDNRALSTWLSFPDLVRFALACLRAPRVDYSIVWGQSANPAGWWHADDRARVGWAPRDSAEPHRARVENIRNPDPVAERFMGGGFCTIGYSRRDG